MNDLDLSVLRAIARLARSRKNVGLSSIAARVSVPLEETLASLSRLARASFVQWTAQGLHLTLSGLAIAVASSAPVAPSLRAERPVARSPHRRAA